MRIFSYHFYAFLSDEYISVADAIFTRQLEFVVIS